MIYAYLIMLFNQKTMSFTICTQLAQITTFTYTYYIFFIRPIKIIRYIRKKYEFM